MRLLTEGKQLSVLLCSSFDLHQSGGLSTHVNTLEHCLRFRGVDVDKWSPHCGIMKRGINKVRRLVMPQSSVFTGHTIAERQRCLEQSARKELKGKTPAIVHCHDVFAACLPWEDILGYRPSVVLTVHGYALYEICSSESTGSDLAQVLLPLEVQGYTSADRVISVDRRIHDYVEEQSGVDSIILKNAVDVRAIRSSLVDKDIARRKLGIRARQAPVIAVPRRLVPKNGVEYAIRSVPLIKQRIPSVTLLVAGKGQLLDSLKSVTKELEVGDNIVFLGDVKHESMYLVYSASDIVTIPSVPHEGVVEATSISLLESMASGVPVVGSRIGGITEILDYRPVPGLLVSPGSPEELAEAALQLLLNDSLYQEVMDAALGRVLHYHDISSWFDAIMRVYAVLTD